jgi:hypothetical protein
VYWWKVFRSIIFLEWFLRPLFCHPQSLVADFSSWFAYNTNHESRITPEDLTVRLNNLILLLRSLALSHLCLELSTNTAQLYQPPSHTDHRSRVISERVSELGRLAAYIALDLKTASQPKAVQARVHFRSLNEWHRTLPPPMQLSRLSLADPLTMNWHTKRSLLQLHILFLGLFIEPYRTCLIDLGRIRLNDTPCDPNDLEAMKNIEEQCVLAARQSARVASLLQSDNLIRPHCWVSVYVQFTSKCLTSLTQDQVYHLHRLYDPPLQCFAKTARARRRGSWSRPLLRIFAFERSLLLQL